MKHKLPAYAAAVLLVAQVVLMILSWVLSAGVPKWGLRSLIDGPGLRWFLGRYTETLSSPILIYLLLMAIAIGMMRCCGILQTTFAFREKIALRFSIVTAILYVVAILSFVAFSDAILLGVTGTIYPSPFASAVVPLFALGISLVSGVYGFLSGNMPTIGSFYQSCISGLQLFAPLLLFYILISTFYQSLLYVMG